MFNLLGLRFIKLDPNMFVMHYSNGSLKRSGPGLAFFFYAPRSSIVAVPINTIDVPFAFQLVSKDFQTVTLQGQLSYRIAEPKKIAQLLNFTMWSTGVYKTDDAKKLSDRLINLTQTVAFASIQSLTLSEALVGIDALAARMLEKIRLSEVLAMHGVELLTLSILALRPTPEMAKALEAETRENLQQKADQATYARRNAAVEQERKIKESELNTELAVEAKRREIRESQMAAEIAIEQQKVQLLEQRLANEKQEADSRAYALKSSLSPLKEMDWHTLMAINNQGIDSKLLISLAFKELAEKAEKIGTLNVTPDLLERLTQSAGRE